MSRAPEIFTIGHSDRSLAELLALLKDAGITCVVDVRAQPASTRHPHFNMESLRAALTETGIVYHWAGRHLGGLRTGQADSPHTALPVGGLRAFADHMESEAFARAIAQLLGLARKAPTAILCAEHLPENCHRSLIADYLTLQGVSVMHLIDADEQREHQLDPRARRESASLVYDRGTTGNLALN